jgi:hypothetical protein
MKIELLKYIKETSPEIISLDTCHIKDWDDEDSCIGDDYIVECTKISGNDVIKVTCLVNIEQFKHWANKNKAIRFI